MSIAETSKRASSWLRCTPADRRGGELPHQVIAILEAPGACLLLPSPYDGWEMKPCRAEMMHHASFEYEDEEDPMVEAEIRTSVDEASALGAHISGHDQHNFLRRSKGLPERGMDGSRELRRDGPQR